MSFWSRVFRIFLPFALGFFLTSVYRTINAVLAPNIHTTLGISESLLATATASYFFSFAVMQIPVGILLDFYGPRRVQAGLFSIGGVGAILFGLASGAPLLILGRLLLGFGMAGGLMAGLVANRIWFNRAELPMFNSLTLALGSLGALATSVPTYYLLKTIGWSWISILLGLANFTLVIIILIFVPDPRSQEKKSSWQIQLNGLKQIYSNSYFWRVSSVVILFMGSFMNLQSFWISPYLTSVNQSSPSTISYFLLTIGLGTIFGVPTASILEHLLKPMKISINQVIGFGLICSLFFQIFIGINIASPNFFFWFFYAFFTLFVMTAFSSITQHFHQDLAGRATTGINTLVFISLFIFQFIFGALIEAWGEGNSIGYSVAFWFFFVIQTASLLWFIFGTGDFNEE